jgi:hypothetical protein
MLVVILILYVGTTVFAPRATGAGATLTPSCTLSVEWERYLWQYFFFSQDQHVFILEHYFSTRSYADCQNAFRNYFPDSLVPNKSTIQRLVERFRETASIGEKHRYGRPSVLSKDSLEDIRARWLQSPRKSLRKLSQQTAMTYGSVQRDTKRLKLHSYRVLFIPWVAWLLDHSVVYLQSPFTSVKHYTRYIHVYRYMPYITGRPVLPIRHYMHCA